MKKWEWIGTVFICLGFALMITAVVFGPGSLLLLLLGLATLLTGFSLGCLLGDWDPRSWV